MSNNDDKLFKVLENLQTDITALRDGQQTLHADVQKQGKRFETLEADVKGLHAKVDAVELKVEAIHAYQKQAHDEIMGHVIDIAEMTDHDHKALEKRTERIEKHLRLPPVK
jgi:chromosome segregation ATPase